MQATKDFHFVNKIPNGATLVVEASGVTGNAQADARFLSGAEGVDDAKWTLADMTGGKARTSLAGLGISWVRVRLALAKGAKIQIDMTIQDQGKEIRRRTWNLDATAGDRAGRLGWIITVLGPGQ